VSTSAGSVPPSHNRALDGGLAWALTATLHRHCLLNKLCSLQLPQCNTDRGSLVPAGYTHVLKTDDDSYVRVSKVLDALRFDASTPPGTIRRRLPGLHQALLQQMARDGSPLHTDGISLWNASQLVASAGAMAGEADLHSGRNSVAVCGVKAGWSSTVFAYSSLTFRPQVLGWS
jgi:hypothetical protein